MQYNTIVGSLGMALSGGQKQRVLLARALYRRPALLFLDESLDQVDYALEREITKGIRGGALAIAAISHRSETVLASDRSISLAEARVSKPGVIAAT
jgi:ATP-binding cassette subfamily B protein RaxB